MGTWKLALLTAQDKHKPAKRNTDKELHRSAGLGLWVAGCAAQGKTHLALGFPASPSPTYRGRLRVQSQGQFCGIRVFEKHTAPRGKKSLRETGFCKGHPRLSLITCVTPAWGVSGSREARSMLVGGIRKAKERLESNIRSLLSQQMQDVAAFCWISTSHI